MFLQNFGLPVCKRPERNFLFFIANTFDLNSLLLRLEVIKANLLHFREVCVKFEIFLLLEKTLGYHAKVINTEEIFSKFWSSKLNSKPENIFFPTISVFAMRNFLD